MYSTRIHTITVPAFVYFDLCHVLTDTGAALRSTGGPSFDAAVKEVGEKTTLTVTEGQLSHLLGVLFLNYSHLVF